MASYNGEKDLPKLKLTISKRTRNTRTYECIELESSAEDENIVVDLQQGAENEMIQELPPVEETKEEAQLTETPKKDTTPKINTRNATYANVVRNTPIRNAPITARDSGTTSYNTPNLSTPNLVIPTLNLPCLPSFTAVKPTPSTGFGNLNGKDLENIVAKTYNEIISWRKKLFMLPAGNAAKQFINELYF